MTEKTKISHEISSTKGISKALVTANKKGNPKTEENMPGWHPHATKLNAYKNGIQWNRGHKISHRLGGDGKNIKNLFIITTGANLEMADTAEHVAHYELKKLIMLEGHFNDRETFKNKIIYYEIDYNNYPNPFKAFPSDINIEWGYCDVDGKNPVKLKTTQVDNDDPSKIKGHININNISPNTLDKLTKNDGMIVSFWLYVTKYRKGHRYKGGHHKIDSEIKYQNITDLTEKLIEDHTSEAGIGENTLKSQLKKLKTLLYHPTNNPNGEIIIKP